MALPRVNLADNLVQSQELRDALAVIDSDIGLPLSTHTHTQLAVDFLLTMFSFADTHLPSSARVAPSNPCPLPPIAHLLSRDL